MLIQLVRTIVLLSIPGTAFAQSAASFEVASVKSAPPGELGGRIQFLPGGRLEISNVAIRFIIQTIYQVKDFQIAGDANWMAAIADGRDARYYVQAKAADESATEAQMREMAKALLADRFQLKLHRETRDMNVYALIPARNGVKLDAPKSERRAVALMARGWMQADGTTIDGLMGSLSQYMDRPLIDKTGFGDPFSFRLTWTPEGSVEASENGCPAGFAPIRERFKITEAMNCPSIFTAVQEQMGLKLDARKAPVEVLVIDHVERPSAN